MPSLSARTESMLRFIENRTGLVSALKSARTTQSPAGRSWAYGFGTALTVLMALMFLSGIGLSLFYSPSTNNAWASVAYLEREVPIGAFIRGLHYQGTNVLMVVMGLHLLHVVLSAGYRNPREATWWAGLALAALVLAAAMTGALLPLDDQGYWASRVEIGIMGTVPVIGAWVQQIALGGNDLGNLTITRYYALHAIVVPSLICAVVGMHIYLVKRHGIGVRLDAPPSKRAIYWPTQAARDSVVTLLVLGVTFGAALKFGAPLEAPADPSGTYPARPVWYFRALFELRRHFEGPIEPVATMVIPGLIGAFFAALPFIDTAPTRRKRLPVLAVVLLILTGGLLATSKSMFRDARDKKYDGQRADSKIRAARALTAAHDGVPPEGALFMLRNTPESRGEKLFGERCSGCHTIGGTGTDKPNGPDLAGYLNRDWLTAVVSRPGAPEMFGHTKVSGMDPFEKIGPEKLAVIAGLLHTLRRYPNTPPAKLPPALKPAVAEYEAQGCDSCHSLTPGEASGATNLSGYGSDEWLTGLMLNPGAETYFGDDNDMPSYSGKLSDREMKSIITYLRLLEDKPRFQNAVAVTDENGN